MTDYANWNVLKSVINYNGNDEEKIAEAQAAQAEYTAVAEWCNEGRQYRIIEDGEYYKTELIPEPTPEEKAESVRSLRNKYLEQYVDPYVCNPLRWADLTQAEQEDIINYRLYLLNIPQDPDFPDVEVKTFDEWKAGA